MVNSETGLSMFVLGQPRNICVILSRAQKNSWESQELFAYRALARTEPSYNEFLFILFNAEDTEKASKRHKTLA